MISTNSERNFDVVIVGGGMVGLSIANQLIEKKITNSILIIDKEEKLGLHSSGRNSGVLHAGLYYEPNSLKAKVCVSGAKRLKSWVLERGLPINECGKLIIPTRDSLDSQLEVLAFRGKANGAKVEFWDENQVNELVPDASCPTGRALWSPNTAVVKPIKIINTLQEELFSNGVKFVFAEPQWSVYEKENTIEISNNEKINYGHLINCAGLQGDRVAHKFEIGEEFILMPFKGVYYQIKLKSKLKIPTNLYPVPDLDLPFLGVHFTPNHDQSLISIGPTASFAFGRENYRGLKSIEPLMSLENLKILSSQYLFNRGGFRKYVHEQAFLSMKGPFLESAKKLIPKIKSEDIELSPKVGIRAQLFNKKKMKIENDFICQNGKNSTHILNAISPAFTASFALADYIIDNYINFRD